MKLGRKAEHRLYVFFILDIRGVVWGNRQVPAKLSSVSSEVPAGVLGERSGAPGDLWVQTQSGSDNLKTLLPPTLRSTR